MTDYIDAAQKTLADTLQAGAIEIQSAVLNLNKSGAALRSLELNVELALESYDLVSRSYDVGEADYLQVQTADDDLNTARIQLLNEKFNYASALQDLNFAIARELEVQAKPLEGQDTKE
jgi:outer membrane protein TolC